MRVINCLFLGLVLWVAGACTDATAQSLPAESGSPLSRWWLPEDYRAHQQVWDGAQTPDGIMWFGNAHSVLRFDGERWSRIEVPTSFVRAIATGADGRLWAGGTDELGVIEPGADGLPIYRSLIEFLPENHRAPGVVRSLVVREDGVFFATESRVLRWDGAAFEVWAMENFSRQLLMRVGDELLLHRQGVGLYRYVGHGFERVADEPRWQSSVLCRVVAQADGSWVMLLSDGLLWRWIEGGLERFGEEADAVLDEITARYVTRLDDGTLVVGGRHGVVWLDADGHFVGRWNEASGMGNETVFSLTPDREGGLWVGSDLGVGRLSLGNGISRFGEVEGLPRSMATALVRHHGVVHAAYDDGIYRLDPAEAATGTPAKFERVIVLGSYTWALASHAKGLLIGTGNGVWWRADGAEPELALEVRPGVGFLQPAVDDPDRVWAGCFAGLLQLRWDGERWREEPGLPELDTEVRSLAASADGTVWIGTPTRGFGCLRRGESGAWTVSFYGEEAGLRADHGWCHVYRDGNGEPLFVTDTGTYRFDAQSARFGIASDVQIPGRSDFTQLWPLSTTADGGFWAQADTQDSEWPRLIGRIDPAAEGAGRWTPLPRLAVEAGGYGGMRGMVWEAERRRLWLMGSGVLVAVDVDETRTAESWAPVMARATLPDGRVVGAAPGWRYLYGRAPLALEFGVPAFGEGPGRLYRIRMQGYDDVWSSWQTEPRASFTNLRGGQYAFEVQTREPDGRAGGIARVALTVVPPWWRSTGAWAAYTLLGAVAAWGAMRWRLAAVERRAAWLETVVGQRTTELVEARDAAESASRAKSEFVAGISHELRHPLQSILGHAELLQGNTALPKSERDRGAVIEASGRRLLRLIDDVLDVARMDAGRLSLRPESCDLGALVDRMAATHAPVAASRGLRWRVRRSGFEAGATVHLDAERVGQIVDNLVSNALKFAREGEVGLRVTATADGVRFAVRDEGPGIAPEEQARIFESFEQGNSGRESGRGVGLGLAISRGLATLMGGSLTVESEVGRGSCFTLWVPTLVEGQLLTNGAATPDPALGWGGLIGPLREAAGCGDLARLRVLVAMLAGEAGAESLAADLARLLEQFQLTQIRRVLDETNTAS